MIIALIEGQNSGLQEVTNLFLFYIVFKVKAKKFLQNVSTPLCFHKQKQVLN